MKPGLFIINLAIKQVKLVMPDLISLPRQEVSRGHPVYFWIPAFAGMTALGYSIAGPINRQTTITFLPGTFFRHSYTAVVAEAFLAMSAISLFRCKLKVQPSEVSFHKIASDG